MASFNLYYLLKGPIQKCSHTGVRVPTYEFGGVGDTVQSIIGKKTY